MNIRSVCAVASLALGAAMGLVDRASAGNLYVPGTSNPFLAGMPNGSTCCSGDPARRGNLRFTLAPSPLGKPSRSRTSPAASVSAAVHPTTPPDGGSRFGTPPNEGGLTSINDIAGFHRMPVDALLGVFLGPGLPTSNPAPGLLNFRDHGVARFGTQVGTHFVTLSPELQQIFFIGDGLTGTGSGSVQTFIAPAGATRLYLGVADGYGWANNSGAFDVCVNCGSAVPVLSGVLAVPQLSSGSSVPEPATWAMMLLGFGGLGFGGYLRSKKDRLAVLAA